MASVTSLDRDLRSLRLSRYTPQAAGEVRDWIEEVLQERLPSDDLLDALKDGVALCKLVNLAVSPGLKYKQSSMPFVQMENISHFLRACQIPPLNLPPHDVFLTVDLYEGKDPAQVLQCIMAFSRRANAIQPSKFRRPLGPQSNKSNNLSPNVTGSSQGPTTPSRFRGASNVSVNSSGSATSSPTKSPTVSSWSKTTDKTKTAPAWNFAQYGYMGGADQGNQGVVFGGRRQITTAAPVVPSLAEKEKRRREAEERAAIEQREKVEAEEARRQQQEAEEERAQLEEERLWEEQTARLREKERRQVEEEKRRWDEEQRQWEAEERRRLNEEKEAEERMEQEKYRRRSAVDNRLNGQFLSQYQADQAGSATEEAVDGESQERQRIKQLEQELEHARERERQYQSERDDLRKKESGNVAEKPRPRPVPPKPSYTLSSLEQERRMLRSEWQNNQDEPEPVQDPSPPPPQHTIPRRPLPEQPIQQQQPPQQTSPRPLPDPTAYANQNREDNNRVDRFLASNRPPVAPKPASHRPADYTTTAEVDAENSRREDAQQKTRAGGWASKSLLEREMERERERQREWEDNQKNTEEAAKKGLKDPSQGSGPGGAWNVFQYGYMGGDNQARGGPGLGIGGARRQIIGPRPPP